MLEELEREYAAIIREMRATLASLSRTETSSTSDSEFRGVRVVCHASGAVCVASDETKKFRAHFRAAGASWRAVRADDETILGWDFASKTDALAALASIPA